MALRQADELVFTLTLGAWIPGVIYPVVGFDNDDDDDDTLNKLCDQVSREGSLFSGLGSVKSCNWLLHYNQGAITMFTYHAPCTQCVHSLPVVRGRCLESPARMPYVHPSLLMRGCWAFATSIDECDVE